MEGKRQAGCQSHDAIALDCPTKVKCVCQFSEPLTTGAVAPLGEANRMEPSNVEQKGS